jgi:hypothetical protein
MGLSMPGFKLSKLELVKREGYYSRTIIFGASAISKSLEGVVSLRSD